MTRAIFCYGVDCVCNASRILMKESRAAPRKMSGTVIQAVKEVEDNYSVLDSSCRYSIRSATESDVPEILKIRAGIESHDVLSVIQTAMKMDPEGLQIAVNETGKIIGSICSLYSGDDSSGTKFGGMYYVDPKYRKTGIGLQIFKVCMMQLGDANGSLNAVPSMKEVYKYKGDFSIEEKDWVCLKNQTPNSVSPEVLSDLAPPGVDIQPFNDSFLPKMVAYDEAVVGFRRSILLSMSCREEDSKTIVALKNGDCVGFGSIKKSCLGAGRVGPLYADDPAVAEVILRKLLESFPDRKGFAMMTLSNNIHANYFLKKLDCPVKDECHRLYKRKRAIADTSKIYALFDFNYVVF